MIEVGVAVGAGLAGLMGVLKARALRLRPEWPGEAVEAPPVDQERVAAHLAAAIRCPTISHQDPAQFAPGPFAELHRVFARSFPRLHAALRREVVSEHSLLYTWEGSDPSLRPALLVGHLDVVPIEAGTEEKWTHPPFAGAIEGGFVWGRGTLDTKGSVVAILEAVEALLERGFRPRRTVYLAFGHDEEVSGRRGAKAIADLLRSRGVELEWAIDEGGAILAEGAVPGVRAAVALVGVAEKGYLSLRLVAEGKGGHSALPARDQAVVRLARAIHRLERRPFPPRLQEPALGFLRATAPWMPLGRKLALANLWLTRPFVARAMTRSPATAALVRTTTATTTLQAGTKENIVPQRAEATVNLRLLPGETTEAALARVRRVVGPGVRVEPVSAGWNPSPVSSTDTEAYRALSRVVRELFPRAVVAPNLVVGATDSRYYAPIAGSTFRFVPIVMTREDMGRIHGTDERISVESLAQCVAFFVRLIEEAA
ncbi:MAG: Peptidase, M20/M25/M40 family [Candidatus Bipolaricaulis sibiricus]|uniref:Peptidase, M20/M25/M40 family n=1 Tax=Bipolaricaulis sibiricus TaxID=2501609 RepID=A0A410FSU9_BIPS1|nr:MAG: Peptidase, M20/M25/M40 family [Candidatus Bipolaricaulis sibiricus]